MPKSTSAPLAAHIGQMVTSTTWCFKLKRRDGVIVGMTSFNTDLPIDLGDGDGSIIYYADGGMLVRTDRQRSTLAVDSMDLDGLFQSALVSETDLRAGIYDGAEIEMFEVNWADLSQGRLWHKRSYFGEVTLKDNLYLFEARGIEQRFAQNICEVYQKVCRAKFGDARCGAPIDPAVWVAATPYAVADLETGVDYDYVTASVYDGRIYKCTVAGTSDATEPVWDTTPGNLTVDGTVTWTCVDAWTKEAEVTAPAPTRTQFQTDLAAASVQFSGGVIVWLTGLNAGLAVEVKLIDSGSLVDLYLAAAFDVVIGDTFKIRPGCDGALATCRDTFDRVHWRRAEDYLPGEANMTRYPDVR